MTYHPTLIQRNDTNIMTNNINAKHGLYNYMCTLFYIDTNSYHPYIHHLHIAMYLTVYHTHEKNYRRRPFFLQKTTLLLCQP